MNHYQIKSSLLKYIIVFTIITICSTGYLYALPNYIAYTGVVLMTLFCIAFAPWIKIKQKELFLLLFLILFFFIHLLSIEYINLRIFYIVVVPFSILFASLWYFTEKEFESLIKYILIFFIFISLIQFNLPYSYDFNNAGDWYSIKNTGKFYFLKRAPGLQGNPNTAAAAIGLLFLLILIKKPRVLYYILAISVILLIFKSRSALLAITFSFGLILLLNKNYRLILLLLFFGTMFLAIFYIINPEYFDMLLRINYILYQNVNSLTTRIITNTFALDYAINNNFLLGHGVFNEVNILERISAPMWISDTGDLGGEYTESLYVKFLLEAGIIGTLLIFSIFFVATKINKKIMKEKSINSAIIVYFLIYSIFETGFGNIQLLPFFLIIMTLRRNSYGVTN